MTMHRAGDEAVPAGVSVVIPVKDDERLLRCVASVLGCEPASADEIIVVDNGCSPAFQGWLTGNLPPQVRRVSLADAGVYAARNAGIECASGGMVLFTDADCVVEPGWIVAATAMLERGADIVQGYSGTVRSDRISCLLQSRYDKHLRRVAAGQPTECDTRNLAVRRSVFEAVRFNARYRRVGDTEFGLVAESLGLRVAYAPEMRVEHEHARDLRLFVAKQYCHGWGAQRLMQNHPEVRWHGGHLYAVSHVSRAVQRLGTLRPVQSVLRLTALTGATVLQRTADRLPWPAAYGALTALDKLAALAGHLSYAPGGAEPSPSTVLGRQLARD